MADGNCNQRSYLNKSRFTVRTWDDNFIFKERIEEIAQKYNSSELVEIGRDGLYENIEYIGGGASSLVSGKLVQKMIENIMVCPTEITAQEDVTISICRKKLGASFIYEAGFKALAPEWASKISIFYNISQNDLSCRKPMVEKGFKDVVPISFHYVSPAGMILIDKSWYLDDCMAL
jgi:hypothetical protein